jgi:hypothetical protein
MFQGSRKRRRCGELRRVIHSLGIGLVGVIAIGLFASIRTPAQTVQTPNAQTGQIVGTVTDTRGDPVAGATVVLAARDSADKRTLTSDENGSLHSTASSRGFLFLVVVSAAGFADWTSPAISLQPGEIKLIASIALKIATLNTTVTVAYSPVEIATQQMKLEERQRVYSVCCLFGNLGNVRNFPAPNFLPLTAVPPGTGSLIQHSAPDDVDFDTRQSIIALAAMEFALTAVPHLAGTDDDS